MYVCMHVCMDAYVLQKSHLHRLWKLERVRRKAARGDIRPMEPSAVRARTLALLKTHFLPWVPMSSS